MPDAPLLLADSITVYLFESPGLPVAVLAVAWAVIRIAGVRRDSKRLKQISWIPLALILALMVTASMVKTEREHLSDALSDLLLAVENEDSDLLKERVHPDAMTQVLGKEFDRDSAQLMLKRAKIEDLMLLDAEVLVTSDDVGTTFIRVRAKGSVSEFTGVNFYEWAIRWAYEEGRWRAIRLKCTSMGVDAALQRNRTD